MTLDDVGCRWMTLDDVGCRWMEVCHHSIGRQAGRIEVWDRNDLVGRVVVVVVEAAGWMTLDDVGWCWMMTADVVG